VLFRIKSGQGTLAVHLDGTTLISKGSEIRCYDYVNHPDERVRDALRQDALTVFQLARKAAAAYPQ